MKPRAETEVNNISVEHNTNTNTDICIIDSDNGASEVTLGTHVITRDDIIDLLD